MAVTRTQFETVERLRNQGKTFSECGVAAGISESAARRIMKQVAKGKKPTAEHPTTPTMSVAFPSPAPEAGGPMLPKTWAKPLVHLQIDTPGWWLVLGDTHMPMHDEKTITLAIAEARAKGAVGVLFNGDILDCFGVTPFFREDTEERFHEEVEIGKQFFEWVRSQLPRCRFVYREGNHEFRLRRYIREYAPALSHLDVLKLPKLLDLDKFGVEWVQDKRQIRLGKLITLHGHEFRKGTGINPARLAFLRATATCIVSHHHRSSDHPQRTLDDKLLNVWSVGCACFMHPDYDPYNQWNHGYAMVEVNHDGTFSVHNRKVIDGRVV